MKNLAGFSTDIQKSYKSNVGETIPMHDWGGIKYHTLPPATEEFGAVALRGSVRSPNEYFQKGDGTLTLKAWAVDPQGKRIGSMEEFTVIVPAPDYPEDPNGSVNAVCNGQNPLFVK